MKISLFLLLLIMTLSCNQMENVDLIIKGKIYTVNENFTLAEAVAVKNGRIVDIGSWADLNQKYTSDDTRDFGNKPVYPGFYDAHCHFLNYGISLQEAILTGASSLQEVTERLKRYAAENPHKEWITGRGWDQNDWEVKQFPDKSVLDSLFPDRPVYLSRIDGHAAWVNSKALQMAGINEDTEVVGGQLLKNPDGSLKGILVDNAMNLVNSKIPPATEANKAKALLDAQQKCFEVGLTTVSDAGLPYPDIMLIDSLYNSGELKMNIYSMVTPTPETLEKLVDQGPLLTPHFTVRSVKLYADGALGSRGAHLLTEYTDDPGNTGLELITDEYILSIAKRALKNNYQLNVHCIGDAANRRVLQLMSQVLEPKNDKRWRIEHAQIVTPDDQSAYAALNVIPSIQPTHATSDMYWVEERLGPNRVKYAYAFKDLLEKTGIVAIGSDFPVEDINPLYGFFAAVARKDHKGYPEGGFQPENKLSREEALRGMTIWAAYANFEEDQRGSLEKDKEATFTVLEEDIMEISEEKIPEVKVSATFIKGEQVF